MSVLRTDEQIETGRLLAISKASAQHFRDAAERVEPGALRDDFSSIADRRVACARGLEAAIRALGELPTEPNPDRESLKQVIAHLAAAVSSDEETETLRQRLGDEENLGQTVRDKIAKTDFSPVSRPAVIALAEAVEVSVQTLRKRLMDREKEEEKREEGNE